jgi:hypothetical protein
MFANLVARAVKYLAIAVADQELPSLGPGALEMPMGIVQLHVVDTIASMPIDDVSALGDGGSEDSESCRSALRF